MNQDNRLSLRILTPQGSILQVDSLYSINVPLADDFPIGIHPNHTPLIAETVQGIVKFRNSDQENQIELLAGILDIRDNTVTILTPGNVATTPDSVSETSQSEYDRIMQTLQETFDLNTDIDETE